MLTAYHYANKRLVPMPAGADLRSALWIDLFRGTAEEEAEVRALGVDVPSLADMEEIEISNRLYHEDDADYLTVVMPCLLYTSRCV